MFEQLLDNWESEAAKLVHTLLVLKDATCGQVTIVAT